ncbi:transport protein [Klebsiella grimontii]|uniref:Transport protein n=1 Tax=Klebsiella grimontii TaxID=2058152 RepID=A0A7H4P322_9ENTR|nr:transport protein [Klebsiella grimontii]
MTTVKNERTTSDLIRAAVSGWFRHCTGVYGFPTLSLGAALVFHEIFFPEQSAAMALILAMEPTARDISRESSAPLFLVKWATVLGAKRSCLLPSHDGDLYDPHWRTANLCSGRYFSAGVLVTLRIIQGLGAGAEISGAGTMLAEYAPKGKRGIISSLVAMGTNCGTLSATAIWAVMFFVLDREQLVAWGWRIPFPGQRSGDDFCHLAAS